MMAMLCVSATGECINAFAKMDFRATGKPALVRTKILSHDCHFCTLISHCILSCLLYFVRICLLCFSVVTRLTFV